MQPPITTTCWDLIDRAAHEDADARTEFVRRYSAAIRAYLAVRWKGSVLSSEMEDATQEVFYRCFRSQGALQRVHRGRGMFRAFLFGIIRNVARQVEERKRPSALDVDSNAGHFAADEASSSAEFDKALILSLIREGMSRWEQTAANDEEARLRIRLLHAKVVQGEKISVLAQSWKLPARVLYRQYALARQDFERVLKETLAVCESDGTLAAGVSWERLVAELG
jgi:DNA-directed RNA polymerase specialized sigma24 family protein